jgi:hypothetical protein
MVEQRRREIKIVRKGREGVEDVLEDFDIEQFVEEKEMSDGTVVMKIRIPRPGSKASEESGPLRPAAGVSGAIGDLQAKLGELVRQARTDGYTWTQIGAALGMSKQAAWERFSGED